jgi:hypothetical protein
MGGDVLTAMVSQAMGVEEIGSVQRSHAATHEPATYDIGLADVHSEELRAMADSLDEVRGCLKAAIGWKSLSEGGRRDLLLRALHNAEGATRTLVRLDTTIDLTGDGA